MSDREFKQQVSGNRDLLSARGLWANDPKLIDDLADRLDPSAGLDPVFPVIHYDTRLSTKEKVRCSVCPQRQPHNDGYVVRTLDGRTGLVGNTCGASHFGTRAWNTLTEMHTIRVRRAISEAARLPAADMLAEGAKVIRQWSIDLAQVDTFQDACLEWFSDALNELKRLPGLAWFFDGYRLSVETEALADQFQMVSDQWRNSGAEWTETDRNALVWLRRSMTRLFEKHEAIISTIANADYHWGRIAQFAGRSAAGAQFFYNPNKRQIRAREFGGGSSFFLLPDHLGPLPDLSTLLGLLPALD